MELTSTFVLNPSIRLHFVAHIAALVLHPANLQASIKIHSSLADGGLLPSKNTKGQTPKWESIKLWYFLRAVDPSGSGWGELNLHQSATFFNRSIYTIRRWVAWGKALRIFRAAYHLGNGFYRIHYAALPKVALSQGLTELGGIAYVESHKLKTLKFVATESTTMRLQTQSLHKEAGRLKASKKRILTPTELVQSELGTGSILFRRGRFTFLKFNTPDYGTTQNTIAYSLGRHTSTVQRRLSNSYRQSHEVGAIAKTQLATAPRTYSEGGENAQAPSRVRILPGQRIIRITEGVFRLGTNVYDSTVQPTSAKAQRWRLKAFVRQAESDNSWKLDPRYEELLQAWKQAANDKPSLSVEKIAPAVC